MQLPTILNLSVASSIAWFYLISNSLRGFTYIPQIVAVWRSRDGAKSLSLLTWCSWMVAHVAAVLYGLVLRDPLFTTISLINLTGCAAVTSIAAQRRQQSKREFLAISSLHWSAVSTLQEEVWPEGRSAAAYLSRWGYSERWLADGAVPIETGSGVSRRTLKHHPRWALRGWDQNRTPPSGRGCG